jgi:HAD superfamily hydrolase (TIGR01509 family)
MSGASIGAVIFDCDGTLVDSEPIAAAAWADEVRALDPAVALDDDDLQALKGQGLPFVLDFLGQRIGRALPHDIETRVRHRMAVAFRERLQPIPGAMELLQSLSLPYCVASNGPRQKMELTLGVTGLLPWLQGRIFSAYEVGSFKPEPGLFLHAARELGVAPERCAVVEDSLTGIEAGLAAGMTVYALPAAAPLPREWAARVQPIDGLHALMGAAWNPG